jgi:hypothetical protein
VCKVFSKNYAEYNSLRVDLGKMAFVSKNNPKNAVEEERNVYLRCEASKFSVDEFEDFENKLLMAKVPTEEELR